MKHSKRFRALGEKVSAQKYALDEAIKLVKELASAKYDESIDLSIKLNIDPKKTDQLVRGISQLPHGTGKKKTILVLTKGEKEKEAKDAGADHVGFDDYIEKIKKASEGKRIFTADYLARNFSDEKRKELMDSIGLWDTPLLDFIGL